MRPTYSHATPTVFFFSRARELFALDLPLLLAFRVFGCDAANKANPLSLSLSAPIKQNKKQKKKPSLSHAASNEDHKFVGNGTTFLCTHIARRRVKMQRALFMTLGQFARHGPTLLLFFFSLFFFVFLLQSKRPSPYSFCSRFIIYQLCHFLIQSRIFIFFKDKNSIFYFLNISNRVFLLYARQIFY